MTPTFRRAVGIAASLVLTTPLICWGSGPAYFVVEGRLAAFDGAATQKFSLIADAGKTIPLSKIERVWGTLPDGRVIVSLPLETANRLDDPSGRDEPLRGPFLLVRPDGSVDAFLPENILRAFPSPATGDIALITRERRLLLWSNGATKEVETPGRVSAAAWSPDGRRLALTVYPPDWSQHRVNEARTTAEFLRLQNADIYLADGATGALLAQLTDSPDTEYGAFFGPDGVTLYYVWLHLTEDQGGLMRLILDADGGTTATGAPVKLTVAGNDPGETPLGRVGTYMWTPDRARLVFEAGRPDGSGEIWTMAGDGSSARMMAAGRFPQVTVGGRIAYQKQDGQPALLEVQP
ncbi:MAG: hypothetical protein N2111_10930 [Candidatus Sumerlaeaceae bacterium]|nr:hypothetical protein [Candidatus Sumerlaeaceae bacterium]